MAADRDLLFGLLALQNGLIDQGQLVAAFQAWTRDRSRPLADHLADRGDLDADSGRRRGAGRAAPEEATAATPSGASPHPRRPLDPRVARRPRATPRSSRRSPMSARDSTRRRRTRPHGQLRRRRGHSRRPAVPRPAAARPRRPGRRLRRARRRAEPRGGPQADPRPATPTTRRAARFLLEAEITGGLEHPGIVPVYGLGTYDGRPAVLRHAVHPRRQPQGGHRPLPRRRRDCKSDPGRRSLELRKLLRRFTDVCNAIDYAHQPRRAAPRHQAGQHHRRQARRDAGRRLGAGQGDGPDRARAATPTSGR